MFGVEGAEICGAVVKSCFYHLRQVAKITALDLSVVEEGLQKSTLHPRGRCAFLATLGCEPHLGWRAALQHHGLPDWDSTAAVWGDTARESGPAAGQEERAPAQTVLQGDAGIQ
ncbi:hypothetical protein SRHO_G00002340 [Serrasalmus rhombeus]